MSFNKEQSRATGARRKEGGSPGRPLASAPFPREPPAAARRDRGGCGDGSWRPALPGGPGAPHPQPRPCRSPRCESIVPGSRGAGGAGRGSSQAHRGDGAGARGAGRSSWGGCCLQAAPAMTFYCLTPRSKGFFFSLQVRSRQEASASPLEMLAELLAGWEGEDSRAVCRPLVPQLWPPSRTSPGCQGGEEINPSSQIAQEIQC